MKDGASRVRGRGGRERVRQAEGSAGGGRSLKRKSRHSGKFWFSDPMVRPDPVFSPVPTYLESILLPAGPGESREMGRRVC